MTHCRIADDHVFEGRHVHIPQAGAASGVVRNRTSFPAAVDERTDTVISYEIDEFSLDPRRIRDIDKKQLSYSKRESVMGENIQKMVNTAGNWLLRKWAPESSNFIVRTTGAARLATSSGATGNRKKFRKEDLLIVKTKMDMDDVPDDGRIALLPSIFISDLFEDEKLLARYQNEADLKTGKVLELYGFTIMQRSTVGVYTEAGTPVVKDPGAATAVTDNTGALIWHPYMVERAYGGTVIFDNPGQATHYGDLLSGLVNLGGRKVREDMKGVYSVVEAASA